MCLSRRTEISLSRLLVLWSEDFKVKRARLFVICFESGKHRAPYLHKAFIQASELQRFLTTNSHKE